MSKSLPFFPDAASSVAREVDLLFLSWAVISVFFTLLIAGAIIYFMVKFRRRHEDQVGEPERAALALEIAWSAIPLLICLAMFGWGTRVFFSMYRPPADAVEYWSVGKQWMWKFQHPEGQREINNLHVPVGQSIKLNLQSEDVIHSFYVPAFRVKQDAVPGRQTTVWFRATKPGVYHMFCTEYCGAEHSQMIGSVIVMEQGDYESWLAAGGNTAQPMTASGADLFQSLACSTCHRVQGDQRLAQAPNLVGIFGRQQKLSDGRTVIADESYIRESILNPQAKIVAGWQPLMPTFQGQVTEEQLSQLIAYVKSLSGDGGGAAGGGSNQAGDTAGGQTDAQTPQTAGPASES
ncbi:MAG TPA: cytochrome c oxidase subunit II [Thermoanaerobaculia bacterium]|jgi:cytochrome c oxidase subunit 2|nr:cytochrome c oxidase subunit II [Thermoanaerobaculia bacterium]